MGDLHELFDNPNFRDQDYNDAFAALKADRSYTTSSGDYYKGVLSVSFSPDGRRIVSGSYDRTIRIWDAESGQELSKLEGHTAVVLSVSFSPDGRRIVSGSDDKTIRIWDAESGQELRPKKKRV